MESESGSIVTLRATSTRYAYMYIMIQVAYKGTNSLEGIAQAIADSREAITSGRYSYTYTDPNGIAHDVSF